MWALAPFVWLHQLPKPLLEALLVIVAPKLARGVLEFV
jgi:hypothetical protein